jgi:hypothetical protein
MTVRGNDDEVKTVRRLVGALSTSTMVSLVHATSAAICPVCFCDEVTSPVELPCGHVYCTACLRHLLRSTSQPSISLLRCASETQKNNVKSCPHCKADIQKNGGCNHITCAMCRTHICWVCMKSFAEDSGMGVYAHMRNVHGGIGN